nr:adenosine deaminase [Helcobacillus sp. ACRRO]
MKGGPVEAVRDLRALPKAHLHLHFTGSMRQDTLLELAEEQRLRLPSQLQTGQALRVEPSARGWFRFQRFYDTARRVVNSEEIMRRLLREAAIDDRAEGSVRLELQIDPTSYAPFAGGLTPALELILDEAEAIEQEEGISLGIVVAASRMRHPLEARTLARLAARNAGRVIGFGLSNDERRGDTREFAPAFRIARDAGLAAVPHGGELLGPGHITEVLDSLRPTRLGHGVRAAEDPRLVERLVADGIAFEICPASNVALGVYSESGDVPVRTLLEAGATIALGADDPLLFGSRLLEQYEKAREHGFSDAELARLAEGSIMASTMSDEAKQQHLAGVQRWLETEPS